MTQAGFTEITDTIFLSPAMLEEDIDQLVFDIVKKKEQVFHSQYGIINSIDKILDISTGQILDNSGMIKIQVKYSANTTKPEVGSVLSNKVTKILPMGLMVDLVSIRILVTLDSLQKMGYKYDQAIFSNFKHSISVGDTISFRVIAINSQDLIVKAIAHLI